MEGPTQCIAETKRRGTEAAQQLAGTLMKVIEDLTPGAVPTGGSVKGPRKMEQLGESASTAVLNGLFNNCDPPPGPVLVMDICPVVGDLLGAALKSATMSGTGRTRLYYLALAKDDVQRAFIEHVRQEQATGLHMSGHLLIPGHESPGNMPADISKAALPNPPPLQALILKTPRAGALPFVYLPDVFREWEQSGHEKIRNEAADMKARFVTEFGTDFATGDSPEEPPQKKQRTANPDLIGLDGLTSDPYAKAQVSGPALGTTKLFVELRPGLAGAALVNRGPTEITVPVGSKIAGFGGGKFVKVAPAAADARYCIPYSLRSSADVVVYKNKVMTLGDVLTDVQKVNPEASIAYYELQKKATVGEFELAPSGDLYYVAGEASPPRRVAHG